MKKKAIKKPESIAALAKAKGMSPALVQNRVRRGWSLEDALITPVRKKKKTKPVKVVNDKPRQEIPQPSKTDESHGWLIFILVCIAIVAGFVTLSK